MRFPCAAFVALMLTGAAPAPETGVGPDGRNLAILAPIEGLPTDSLAAQTFVAGLRGVFMEDYFLTETPRTKNGMLRPSEPLTNRFHLVQGDAFGDEWSVQVTVMGWRGVGAGVPPPADTAGARARGMGLRVNIAVLSAAAAEVGARPIPTREDLTLEVPLEPRRDFFAHAGRMVGLLAVEALHHQSGDLDEGTHVRLDRAVRKPIIVRRPPSPHR
jgi:hypothetical protein